MSQPVVGEEETSQLELVPRRLSPEVTHSFQRKSKSSLPASSSSPHPMSHPLSLTLLSIPAHLVLSGWDGQPTMPVAPRNPVPPPPLTQAPSFKGTSLDEHASAPAPALAPAPPPSVPGPHPPAAGPRRPRQQQQGFVTAAEERNKKRHEELEQ